MEQYSHEIIDSLELQNSNIQKICSDNIQNLVNTIHADTSQTILKMIFRDKNIKSKDEKYENRFAFLVSY